MAKSRTELAVEAFKNGTDVAQAVGEPSEDTLDEEVDAEESVEEPETEEEETAEESISEPEEEGTEDEPKPTPAKQPKAKEQPAKKAQDLDVEEVEADGRKFKIDYKDRAATKKAHLEAIGMRKFQRERDDARKELSTLKPKAEELEKLWDKLETAFESEGVDGVIKVVTKGEQSLDKLVEERAERLLRKKNATPAELRAMEDEERFTAEVKRREKIEKELEQIRQRDAETKRQSEVKSLENAIHPAFNQYRFAGKLGDKDVEHRLDKALWANIKSALEELPPDQQITNELVTSMFREEASVLSRMLRKQSEAGADKIVKDRKAKAKEAAQGHLAAGQASGSAKDKFTKQIKGGDLTGALTDLLSGKVRL